MVKRWFSCLILLFFAISFVVSFYWAITATGFYGGSNLWLTIRHEGAMGLSVVIGFWLVAFIIIWRILATRKWDEKIPRWALRYSAEIYFFFIVVALVSFTFADAYFLGQWAR